MTSDDRQMGPAAAAGAPEMSDLDAATIAALPLEQRAAAYGSLLERLRGDLEADGRG